MPAERFKTTRWTLIGAVGVEDERGREALAELCHAYWRPVYGFIRRQGHDPDRAADLTQDVFVHLLEHRGFERADPARGRFRSYLLAAVRNFMVNAHAHDVAQRRGRGAIHEEIDTADAERRFTLEAPIREASPEAFFERQWALATAECAMARLAREYEARGQRAIFNELQSQLTSDSVEAAAGAGRSGAPLAAPDAAGASLSDDARRTALSRLRRRFAEALRDEIKDIVADAGEVDDELRHLLHALK